MKEYKLPNLLNALKEKEYKVFTKPYELNIVGVRSTEQPNKFDDTMCVFWKDDTNKWILKQYPCTTDIGTYYLTNPMNKKLGSAMLKEGQYIDSYKQGLHRGKYSALTQSKKVITYRDFDRNATFDFGQNEVEGMFGINIHKAGENSNDVNNWSAGCQVFKKSSDFDEFMKLVDKQKKLYGNNFTYTLIDTRAIKKKSIE
jgi:hypothetical protein